MTDADWIAELDDDWQYEVSPESVTLRVKTGDGPAAFTEHEVEYAKRRAKGARHDEFISVAELTWHLWVSQLPEGVEPKEHDEIVDAAGDTWVITSTRLEFLDTRFRCQTTKL